MCLCGGLLTQQNLGIKLSGAIRNLAVTEWPSERELHGLLQSNNFQGSVSEPGPHRGHCMRPSSGVASGLNPNSMDEWDPLPVGSCHQSPLLTSLEY